jgi:hypothetical protein
MNAGDILQFTAQGLNCDGTTVDGLAVTWSAEGGTIDGSGYYTAGNTGGTYTVTAVTSASGSTYTGVAPVTVVAPAAVVSSVSVTPNPASVVAGRQLRFTANVNMSDGTTRAFTGTWGTTSGTISSTGLLTAGNSPGTYTVTATQDTVAGTASVQVTPAPTLTSITVRPTTVTLTSGQTQQYTATGNLSDGTTTTVAVTWTEDSDGTINSAGLFTAGATPGSYTVTATASGTGVTGTASAAVTTSSPGAPTAVIAQPPNGFVYVVGSSHILDPTGSSSQGTSNPWNAHWVVKDGSGNTKIDVTGTDGTLAGNKFPFNPGVAGTRTVYLTVIDSFGTTSPTVTVSGTITATAPTLQSIKVNPTPVTLLPGATQQFTALGTFSDGTSKSVPVTWTATGGQITTGGLYTAGPTAGTFTATATEA